MRISCIRIDNSCNPKARGSTSGWTGFFCVTEGSVRCAEIANRSGCLVAWFHRALDGSDASDLLGEHPEPFRIGFRQHPLNEDSEHLHLFRWQGLLGDVRDHM